MARGGCASSCCGLAGLAGKGLQPARVGLGAPQGALGLGPRGASVDCCSHFVVRSVLVGGCTVAWAAAAAARSRRRAPLSSGAAASNEDSERLGLPQGSSAAEIKRACRKVLADLPKETYLFVGNQGTGTRTLLNGLIGLEVFQGPTSQPNQYTIDGDTYVRLTGRVDELQEQAAAAITEVLSQIGPCKVLFVLTEESGRLRPADKALMKLVLGSAHIEDFGIIVNKVSKGLMEKLETGDKANDEELDPRESFLAQLWSAGHFTDLVALNPFDVELSDPGDADSSLGLLTKELVHFIDSVPTTDIMLKLPALDDVQQDQSLTESLEKKLVVLLKDKKTMQREAMRLQVERDYYKLLLAGGCSRADIKRAYWAQIDGAHPSGRPLQEREATDEELRRLTRARNHLLAALPKVDPHTKYLFMCDNGVSRPRALLSALIGEEEAVERRSSGPVSVSHYEYEFDGDTYMALPGLADSSSREQAAEAITRVLRGEGHFKIIFVLGGNGGLSPEDATLMSLVAACSLEDLVELEDCGVISQGSLDQEITGELKAVGLYVPSEFVTGDLWEDYPDGRRVLRAKKLSDFLESLPTHHLKEGAALDIPLDVFDDLYSDFQEELGEDGLDDELDDDGF